MGRRLTLMALFRLPAEGGTAYEAYEAAVLPLVAGHGGELAMRVRSEDGAVEAHLLSFPDQAAFDAYRADPARAAAQELWTRSGASSEVWTVIDLLAPATATPD